MTFELVVEGEAVSIHQSLQDAKEIAEALIPQLLGLYIRSGSALRQFDYTTHEWRQR